MTPSRTATTVGAIVVAAIAIAIAASRFADYAADPHALWVSLEHDRNGHFEFGLNLALALRDLDAADFLEKLSRATVWPPVHGLVLAAVLLIGGIDVKLAIVPSLMGWTATVVLIWLIATRLFADIRTGLTAGGIAVVFALMSPAFGMVTADVMLEGLGAGLSTLCVYLYLRARDDPDRPLGWRLLALALTVLFFEKYNYWLLTAAPLALAFLLDEPQRCRAIATRIVANAATLIGELRNPLTLGFLAILAAVIAIRLHGPLSVTLFGRAVALYPPGNLTTVAYALLFTRLVLAWRSNRPAIEQAIGPALRQIALWHVLPVAVSLLIPRRIAPFMWFLSPTHHHGLPYEPWNAALRQWHAFVNGFHAAPWAGVLAGLGIVLALVMLYRARPALRTVVLVGLAGAAAVVMHPQQQYRFQTTVLPFLWIVSGAGWAMLLAFVTARLPRLAADAVAVTAVAAFAFAQFGRPAPAMAYFVAIHPNGETSHYDAFKAYSPHIAKASVPGFLSTSGNSPFFRWTAREQCKCRRPLAQPFWDITATRQQSRDATAAWLATTPADAVVALSESNPRGVFARQQEAAAGQFDALAEQSRFEKQTTVSAPGYRDITIWRRRAP